MSKFTDYIPETLTRGPFALYSAGLIAIVFVIGLAITEANIPVSLKLILIPAFAVHFLLLKARIADYSSHRGFAYYYNWAVCGLGMSFMFTPRIPSTISLQDFNYEVGGLYLLFLFLALPVLVGGSLHKSKEK